MDIHSKIYGDLTKILVTREEIANSIRELGQKITHDFAGRDLVMVCILKGACVFFTDLMREVDLPVTTEFMSVSSYGSGTSSSGVVRIVKDLDTKIEGRHVIIAEDILDSGLTLSYLMDLLSARRPASIAVAAFAVKDIPGKKPAIKPDYVGTHVPNEFIVGYGLDYAEEYRNLPFIGILKPEVYS